jgi:ketosteroid isomerase-like protein
MPEEVTMSRLRIKNVLATLPVLIAASAAAVPVPAADLAEAQLRAINHRYVNAFAIGDRDYMDALTAADFLLTSSKGDWIERAQHVESMRKPSAEGVSYDEVRVRLFGTVALLHGVFEAVGDQGTLIRVRYTDVYHWDGAHWRLVNAQNTAMGEGIAKQQQLGNAIEYAPWQGEDPKGNDQDVLHALNSNYVRAFREADVSWYDAHLTPDYVVINGDGSFHDRAEALTEFAQPTFATHMRSFPLDKVSIRRFDDIALIHAENAYELKDGRKGVSRYTDIWRKLENGEWRCIAAHITRHKAPE